jgi:hypothetical protein
MVQITLMQLRHVFKLADCPKSFYDTLPTAENLTARRLWHQTEASSTYCGWHQRNGDPLDYRRANLLVKTINKQL